MINGSLIKFVLTVAILTFIFEQCLFSPNEEPFFSEPFGTISINVKTLLLKGKRCFMLEDAQGRKAIAFRGIAIHDSVTEQLFWSTRRLETDNNGIFCYGYQDREACKECKDQRCFDLFCPKTLPLIKGREYILGGQPQFILHKEIVFRFVH